MWIDRLEFIGFGNLNGQRIDFTRDKLSIVVQPNEYGKSTMSEAIWSILYDYPGNSSGANRRIARKPLSGAAFKACIVITSGGRTMRMIRNFAEGSLTILDLSKDPSKADADITHEFAEQIANGTFGEQITGLSRDLFLSTCFIEQRQLDRPPFTSDRALSSLLLSVADTGGPTTNIFDAIGALEEKLSAISFRGKTVPADELIVTLEEQRRQLAESLAALEMERQSCDRDVESLSEVEERLSERIKVVNADEYFKLMLESADVDARLSRAQERLTKINELQQQLDTLRNYAGFPADRQRSIEEMWLRRQARVSDLKRLQAEVRPATDNAQQEKQRNQILETFSIEDAQMLASLARSLEQVHAELADTRRQYESELDRVRQSGTNIDMFVDIRRALLNLEPRELDELHAMHAMVIGTRERQSECIFSCDKANAAVNEIIEGRAMLYSTLQKCFLPSLLFSCFSLVALVYFLLILHAAWNSSPGMSLIGSWLLFCVISMGLLLISERVRRSYRYAEETHARTDALKYEKLAEELASRVQMLEERIEKLAQKANLRSGSDLVNKVQEYAVHATQFKELDFLEHLLKNREQRAQKITGELAVYFVRAGRDPAQANAQTALQLADEITRFHDIGPVSQLETRFDHRMAEIEFLTDELRDADNQLMREFANCSIRCSTVAEGYDRYNQCLEVYRRYEAVRNELEMLSNDSTMESQPAELPKVIERLEARRQDMWARMQDLLAANPEIMTMPPPLAESAASTFGKETSDVKQSVNDLRKQRDELTVQIRAAMKNYQDNYFKITEQLEAVERDIERVRHTRASLTLARDTLLRLADENHAVWSDKLTDIARDMLRHLGTEYDSLEFDSDMRLSVRCKGHREPLNEWNIGNQLSSGTREQLHWLAQLSVLRYLSAQRPLPIILDEPFSEFDDERFLKTMRFLVNTICQQHQVIIFSCHQQRHEWLLEHLDANERQSIEVCRLAPLKADTSAALHR